ncbi:hypothetical protein B0I37DRAFT_190281 [Chaetomium sp. MPI-CAGE-AT-0009]|nr:hypothetical protein B0I37DRAFT_190281 [Chaetomium sp. MPI-CAGE-AT-0009]
MGTRNPRPASIVIQIRSREAHFWMPLKWSLANQTLSAVLSQGTSTAFLMRMEGGLPSTKRSELEQRIARLRCRTLPIRQVCVLGPTALGYIWARGLVRLKGPDHSALVAAQRPVESDKQHAPAPTRRNRYREVRPARRSSSFPPYPPRPAAEVPLHNRSRDYR